MDTKFLKLDNELFNIDYIKYIKCDDDNCLMTIVNTKSGSSIKSFPHTDNSYRCNKYTSPTCYYRLKEFIDKQK